LVFSDKINCFVGNNGAGKTNVLDAIHYLSFCKSYFNPVDSHSIRHETDFFAIHGKYSNSGSTDQLYSCIQKRNSKKVFKENKKDYERLADHIGKIPLVMISPYDRDLINDGSEIRRKYIDSVISQFERIYLNDLINYNKTLLQRNTLLKRFAEQHYFDPESLHIWDEKLAELGTVIHARRKSFLADFNPLFNDYYRFLSGGKETVEIQYESQMHDADLFELFKTNQHKDRMLRYTTCGIHKDDLLFTINGYAAKKYGSQGQQKSFVIAIKLAQFEYTRRIKKFKPILLFDDIFDKLDDSRVESIINLVSENNFGQIFITDTQKKRIEKIFNEVKTDHKIFAVDDGKVQTIDD
jgi:DNA replication and repair protein RecF